MIKFIKGKSVVEHDADFSQALYNYLVKTKQTRSYKIESKDFELKDGLFIKKPNGGTKRKSINRVNKESE